MKSLILLAALCLVAPAQAAEVAIEVHPKNLVKGERLTLGDIAEFKGFNAAETASLKSIALGNAPGYGEKRSYSNQALTEILRAHLKQLQASSGRRIKLLIPDVVSVEGTGQTLSLETLRKGLAENLQRVCEACEYKIEDLRIPPIPAFSPQSVWSLRADYHKLRGPFNVPIEIVSPVGEKSVYWMTGRLSVWKSVPVATRLLSLQDRLEPSDIKWEKRDITFLPDTTPEEAELAGAQVRVAVGPQQILQRSHLVRKKALNRGEPVTITTGSTGWQITLKGIAQDAGYLGDTVRVLNPDTKKIVTGIVVAQGQVEVK
ncbi:MAG TPA: flagellar basal body P-ring formation chaperone FlgA [Bdellovibrionales bacterium]|nr:flagellar basal body P-ring formation chaperone FlgA [Bdellovibrionales bacterium]